MFMHTEPREGTENVSKSHFPGLLLENVFLQAELSYFEQISKGIGFAISWKMSCFGTLMFNKFIPVTARQQLCVCVCTVYALILNYNNWTPFTELQKATIIREYCYYRLNSFPKIV